MLLSLDGTLWVQLLNFLIFLIVLNVIFLRPVGAAIAKRRAYIDGVSADIVQYEADIKSLGTQAEERRATARREADAAAAGVRAAAQNEAATIAAEYAARAAAIVDEAHASVARELTAARQTEGQIVESLADTLLARALGTGVTA